MSLGQRLSWKFAMHVREMCPECWVPAACLPHYRSVDPASEMSLAERFRSTVRGSWAIQLPMVTRALPAVDRKAWKALVRGSVCIVAGLRSVWVRIERAMIRVSSGLCMVCVSFCCG